ncbi:MAG: hypothetical protein PHF00_01285 [Elusimicrobia bacterium]|nr:hypothetical protein [Elusimicrobiota bacterium]
MAAAVLALLLGLAASARGQPAAASEPEPAAGATEYFRLPAAPPEPHLDFTADRLDYDRASAVIHLKGDVRIKESTWTLKGEELWLDTRRRRVRSEGFLLVEDGVSALYGSSGEFDFATHSGVLFNASAGHGDWRVHARKMVVHPSRRLSYSSADFTSCDYAEPHYYFHASRVSVVPRKHFFARNVSLWIGKVPVFYSPFLYKSLYPGSNRFLRMKFQPGYDRRNGGFLKGTMVTQHSAYWRSKLFLDYYSSQGLGTGGELWRNRGEDSRGVLAAYRIREMHGGTERWSVVNDLYQGFKSSFSIQSRLQFMSDPQFNNSYSRASPFPYTAYLLNSGAAVYRNDVVTTRLILQRQDDASGTSFTRSSEDAPRLEAQTAPLKVWRLPWINTFSGFADNNSDRSRPFLQKSVNAAWQGTRSVPLARGLSFTPLAGYSQTYYNRFDAAGDASSTTYRDAAVGRYTLAGTLRLGGPLGASDLGYAFVRRQKPGGLSDDAGAPDRGVESSLASLTHAFRPRRSVLVRLLSAYDLRAPRGQDLSVRQRVQPIVSEVYYTPLSRFNLLLRDDYRLGEGNRNFIFNGMVGEEERTHLSAGAGYNRSEIGSYYFNTEFGWANSTGTLRLTVALRAVAFSRGGISDLHGGQLFDKELGVVKVWHDFYTSLALRLRPGNVKEASVRAEMRLGSFSADRQKVHDWESEWFPERARGREDRP